jgi:hypothetical protein
MQVYILNVLLHTVERTATTFKSTSVLKLMISRNQMKSAVSMLDTYAATLKVILIFTINFNE